MTRRVREFVEIPDRSSLDAVIDTLVALRNKLTADSDAVLRMQGDEVFGRRLSVSYLRPQTPEEAACDARYALARSPDEAAGETRPTRDDGGQGLSLAA
jgi:hypothetical protein